jgi:beta-glucosidase
MAVDGYQFRDASGDGKLDAYEDWRLPVDSRVDDLVAKMSLDEKAGMLMIDTLNAPVPPSTLANTTADRFINTEKMTRFIFRNTVQMNSTSNVSPQQAAEFTNNVQAMAEATRLGIPVIFKSNARNHYERSARAGINEAAGSFSEWPKEPGLAATRDMALIRDFGDTMLPPSGRPSACAAPMPTWPTLATEPRWFRIHETFSEDADLNADIMKNLVLSWQGGPVGPKATRWR